MEAEGPSPIDPQLGSWLERLLFGRPITARRAARIIAGASCLLTLVGGVTAWLVDRDDFSSLGDGLWWALQTVTTVGYGDIVPERTTGRLIGAALMLQGIALIAVVTAAVTAILIEQGRRRRPGSEEQLLAKLEQIESRLEEMGSDGSAREHRPGSG